MTGAAIALALALVPFWLAAAAGCAPATVPTPPETLAQDDAPKVPDRRHNETVPVEKPSTPRVAGRTPPAVPPANPVPTLPLPAPAKQPATIAQPSLADVYVFVGCASANNPADRWSEPYWVKKGLPRMVEEQVLPLYRRGFRRFYVDSPHGKDTDREGKPQFTFFGAERQDERSPWRRNFVESWKRLTSQPGVHVMAYLGNPDFDAEYRRVAGGPDGRARALEMLWNGAKPFLDAGFQGIGIDASASTAEDSALGDFMKGLAARGIAVYIEATPSREQPWLKRFGTIRTTWYAREAHTFKDKVVDPAECAGERIVLYSGTSPWATADGVPFHDWAKRWVLEALARGERPAFGVTHFKDPARELGLKPVPMER